MVGFVMLVHLISGISCRQPELAPSAGEQLEALILDYLDYYWQIRPEAATAMGIHDFDSQLAPSSARAFQAISYQMGEFERRLEALPQASLSPDQRVDRRLLLSDIRVRRMELDLLRQWERDPTWYLPLEGLQDLLTDPEVEAGQRTRSLIGRLRAVPRLLADGTTNLKRPPRLLTETAILSARSLQVLFQETIPQYASALPQLREETLSANQEAREALESYLAFLDEDLLARSDGDLAVGREIYEFYLRELHLLDETADSLIAKAEDYFTEAALELEEAAKTIDPNQDWKQITEEIRNHHPSRETLLGAYCGEIQRSRQHVLENNLATVPEGEEVRCRYTPAGQRAFSPFGDFRTPAPFSESKIGYLILHPIEPGLEPAREEALLRAHDYTWISVIAPHEAYPGHHLQALKAQQNPRIVRKVYSAPIFSEGWGLYCEELAHESGFFRDAQRARVTQLRLRLWRAARILLDARLHTGQITYDEARRFLVEQVRFEESSTAGEVNIYVFRPSYAISYLLGFKEIMRLREEYRQMKGDEFSLREFHDRLLGLGSMPFALVRDLLLETPEGEPLPSR